MQTALGMSLTLKSWLVDMSSRLKRYVKDPDERLKLLRMVHQEATRADLSPELVISVIHVESAFNPYAVFLCGRTRFNASHAFLEKRIGARG